jgi:hypothetical protein
VIFITDIFGWEVDAARVWSDNMAKQVQLLNTAFYAVLQAICLTFCSSHSHLVVLNRACQQQLWVLPELVPRLQLQRYCRQASARHNSFKGCYAGVRPP